MMMNTRWCKILLPNVLKSFNANEVSCVAIFLGANDCSLPTSNQYVPLDEYQQNLEYMITLLESHNIERQKVIFITPTIYFQSTFTATSLDEGEPIHLRSEERQKAYAQAMIELGQRLGVTVVDAHRDFATDGRGEALLRDGLHFSVAGAGLFNSMIVKEVEMRVLAFRGESLSTETMNFQRWTNIDTENRIFKR